MSNTELFDRLADGFWVAVKWVKRLLITGTIIGSVIALYVYWNQIPGWGQLSVFVTPFIAGVSYMMSIGKIKEELTGDKTPLVTLDAREDDLNLAAYGLSEDAFTELTVDETLDDVRTVKGQGYIAEWFDENNLHAKGVWRGSIDNRELLKREEAIVEIRDELEADSRQLMILQGRVRSIVRQSVRDIMMDILRVIEVETVFSGETIGDVIDSALDDIDVEDYADSSTGDELDDEQDSELVAGEVTEDE